MAFAFSLPTRAAEANIDNASLKGSRKHQIIRAPAALLPYGSALSRNLQTTCRDPEPRTTRMMPGREGIGSPKFRGSRNCSHKSEAERSRLNDVLLVGAITRRSQRRLSRIAKGLRARCYHQLALARIAKCDGSVPDKLKSRKPIKSAALVADLMNNEDPKARLRTRKIRCTVLQVYYRHSLHCL